MFCEACKAKIDRKGQLHVTTDGRFEHKCCATGRAAKVYRERDAAWGRGS